MIHTISEVKAWAKGTEQIGDTLFVDGSPYIGCGICKLPIRQVDVFNGTKHVKVANGVKRVEFKPYMVLVGHWLRLPDEVVMIKGVLTAVKQSKPMLHSVQACFSCWNNQQDEKARSNRLVFYDDRKLDKPTPKALIQPKGSHKFKDVKVMLKDTAPRPVHHTQENLLIEQLSRHLPIIQWHPPLIMIDYSFDAIERAWTTIFHIAGLVVRRSNSE